MSSPPDDRFEKLARKMLFLTPDQIGELKARQKEVGRAGAGLSLFEIAQSESVLTQEQLDKVHLAAEYTDLLEEERRIGALAVERGMASEEEVGICIDTQKYEFAAQRAIPRRLTEIMVEAEILTTERSQELMKAYESGGAHPAAPGAAAKAGATARRAAEPTVPYDTKRLQEVDEMARQLDVPPDLAAGPEDTRAEATVASPHPADTPVEASNPAIPRGPTTAPGSPFAGEGATRRISARLILETGEPKGRVCPLAGPGIIGRQTGCTFRIDDNRASREHAKVDYDPQLRHHFVTDLESRNGTFVNDTRITEPTVLNPGDRIRVGDSIFRYEA